MSMASTKRRLQPGAKIQMVRHDYGQNSQPFSKIAGVREVYVTQTNAIQFAGGSWLYWPPASQYRDTENGFQIALAPDFSKLMEYEWR